MTTEATDAPDVGQLENLVGQPLPRTLLDTWNTVLDGAEGIMLQPIGPEWADGLTRQHPKLQYSELGKYVEYYMEYFVGLRDILKFELGNDTERRRIFARVKTDAKMNGHHYLNLLLIWQQQINYWERQWAYDDPDAVVKAAALLDVIGMFFGNRTREGLVAHLNHHSMVVIQDEREWLDEILTEWQKEAL